jgi:flagellar motility protein MotE (MotC chaperone)
MSGTDVAREEAGKPAEPAAKRATPLLAYLRIWLPFPVMLGALVLWQVRSGQLERPAPEPAAEAGVFEAQGAEVPVLLQALQEERGRLAEEWNDLRFARKRLLLEQGELDTRQRDVEALLARVDEKLRGASEEQIQVLDQLGRVYETMKPDAAAEILAGMEIETATEVLRRMKERNAAAILAKIPPETAAGISRRMLQKP